MGIDRREFAHWSGAYLGYFTSYHTHNNRHKEGTVLFNDALNTFYMASDTW